MLPPPPSTIVLARGLATHTRRQAATALKRPLPSSSASSSTSSPLLCRQRRPHPHQNQQQQQQQRSLATETTQATPVPPPPPSGRNRVYPAVLLVTLASVVYVVMTPDDENIDTKIMEAVKARLPPKGDEAEGQAAVAAMAAGGSRK